MQVSRLLELAAAMSSAQEKVTGNSKLDMSGIMAALAMAQEEGVSSNGKGQSSFLHGTFRKEHMESTTTTSSSSLVRAEYVKETTCEETQEEKHSMEMVNAGSKKGSFLYKNMEKTVNEWENMEKKAKPFKDVSNQSKLDIKLSSRKVSDTEKDQRSDESNKTGDATEEGVNDSFLHNSGMNIIADKSELENKKYGRNVAGFKAAFESLSDDCSSLSSSSSTVSSLSPIPNKKYELPRKPSSDKIVQNTSVQPLVTSSESLANYLLKQQNTNRSETHDAVKSKPNDRNGLIRNTTNRVKDEMDGSKEENDKFIGIKDRKAIFEGNRNKCTDQREEISNSSNLNARVGTEKITDSHALLEQSSLDDLLDSNDTQVSNFLIKVAQVSKEKERKTGNGKLDMGELVAAFSSVNQSIEELENRNKCIESTTYNVNDNGYGNTKNGSQYRESFQKNTSEAILKTANSMAVDSFSKKSFSNANLPRTALTLDEAKSSFLESIMNQSKHEEIKPELLKSGKESDATNFGPEKNSLIAELKNIINDEAPQATAIQKRSFNTSPKGYQAPNISSGEDTMNNDTMVKKMVYSQYREMLKSYKQSN